MTVKSARGSDAALVLAATAEERWAREALFRRHAPRLMGLAFRIMGRDEDLEDIVQEAFIEGFERLGKLRDPEAFGSWIGTIVVRQARRRIRRRRMLVRFGITRAVPIDPDSVISPSASPERALELRRLYAAFDDMDAEVRIALVLHKVDGVSLTETAATLGVSLATVKRRIASGEEILRSRVGEGDR